VPDLRKDWTEGFPFAVRVFRLRKAKKGEDGMADVPGKPQCRTVGGRLPCSGHQG
jgi:hypothetical protein